MLSYCAEAESDLDRSSPLTKWTVDTKVAALRQAANREAAAHRKPPKAGEDTPKAGASEPSTKPPPAASITSTGGTLEQGGSNATHVGATAPTWNPPGEYFPFDCTPMEETLRQWLLGPDPTWRQDHHQGQKYAQGAQPTDPLVKVRQEAFDAVATSPGGQAIAASPDRFRAYVHTRLAEAEARLGHQALTLEDVLRDAADMGDEELSTMAGTALDHLGLPEPDPTPDRKSGAAPVEIGLTDWSRGFPGVAMVSWHGRGVARFGLWGQAPFGARALRTVSQACGHPGDPSVPAEVRRGGRASRPRRTTACTRPGLKCRPNPAYVSLVVCHRSCRGPRRLPTVDLPRRERPPCIHPRRDRS